MVEINVTLEGGVQADYGRTRAVTGDVTASNRDVVLADASGGAVTVTLPDPIANIRVVVKKIDASANAVTIATPGTETIDDATSLSLTTQYAARTLWSDGTDYFII